MMAAVTWVVQGHALEIFRLTPRTIRQAAENSRRSSRLGSQRLAVPCRASMAVHAGRRSRLKGARLAVEADDRHSAVAECSYAAGQRTGWHPNWLPCEARLSN